MQYINCFPFENQVLKIKMKFLGKRNQQPIYCYFALSEIIFSATSLAAYATYSTQGRFL